MQNTKTTINRKKLDVLADELFNGMPLTAIARNHKVEADWLLAEFRKIDIIVCNVCGEYSPSKSCHTNETK